jgi:hypothetical protein
MTIPHPGGAGEIQDSWREKSTVAGAFESACQKARKPERLIAGRQADNVQA